MEVLREAMAWYENASAEFRLDKQGIVFLDKYFWVMAGVAAAYLPVVFSLQAFLKNREPLNLRALLVLWNLILVVFNLYVLVYMGPAVIKWLRSGDFLERMCYIPEDAAQGPVAMALFAFALSKVPEMIDTLFIVLHKKPLIVLHWYHHLTVMLYCWNITYAPSVGTGGEGVLFSAMNALVHVIMYTSYGLKAMRFRPPGDMLITVIQLTQMVIGAYIAVYRITSCRVMRPWNAAGGVIMYLSYFYLFADFFYAKYMRKRPKKPAAAAAAAAAPAVKTNGEAKKTK
ncbi:fatty acid elongase [Salpingoeca rosetta]|uniref:Elongation of fatty acids protein n=1 Tax=Salpingoeca rosetta (strain ATCC 50818 / BSB-021) TaxID=946362 RepID=F2UAU0_SALR5|nr:fatty acid elongase [Salpingoeca rosetta]EGD73506.1 fatty acid elongase [Salpingoeca rosetta]|eukprot:XP_004993788.1 fatty acid elongase [Salpingoeca rosetta]